MAGGYSGENGSHYETKALNKTEAESTGFSYIEYFPLAQSNNTEIIV